MKPKIKYKSIYRMSVLLVPGDVHSEPTVRGVEGWLLGNLCYGGHRLHLLLHRQDPGGVSVRRRRSDGGTSESTRLLRLHCESLLRRNVGWPGCQLRANDRTVDDMHSVRCGLWGPDDRDLPRRRLGHPLVDDAHWHPPGALGLPQVLAPRLHAKLLVHHVTHLHKYHHSGLLFTGPPRVGLGQGQMDPGL